MLVVPLLAGPARAVGTLSIYSNVKRRFDPWEIDRLRTFASQAGAAVQNADRLQTIQRLSEVGRSLTILQESPEVLQKTLQLIVDKAVEVMPGEYGGLWLKEPATGDLVLQAVCGPAEAAAREIGRLRASEISINVRVAQTGEPCICDNVEEEAGFYRIYEAAQSSLTAPLKYQGQVIGTLNVESSRLKAFAEEDLQLLSSFADQAAIAIENARLVQELGERAAQLLKLQEVTAAISAEPPELKKVLRLIVDSLSGIFPEASCGIRLYDSKTDKFQPQEATRWLADWVARPPRPSGTSRHVVQTTRAPRYLVGDDLTRPPDGGPAIRQEILGRGVKAAAYLPLRSEQDVIGVLYVDLAVPHEFSRNDKQILELFADQAAIAIENSRLHQQSEVLTKIGRTASTLDINRILDLVYGEMGKVIDLSDAQVQIAFYDEAKDEVSFPLAVEQVDGETIDIVRWSKREEQDGEAGEGEVVEQFKPRARRDPPGLNEYVIRTKEPLLIVEDFEQKAKAKGIQVWPTFGRLDRPTHSWLGVPMMVANRVIGVISIQSLEKERVFDEGQEELLATVASQAAVAIQNARLYHELDRRVQELQVLTEMSRGAISDLGIDQILDLVYEQMSKVIDLSDAQVQIAFYDEAKDEVSFPLAVEQVDGETIDIVRWSKREEQDGEAGEGEVVEQFKPRARRDPPGLNEYVIRTKEPLLIVEDFEQKAKAKGIKVWPTFGRLDRPTHSWLGVPMTVADRVTVADRIIGVISIQSLEKERAFDEEQQKLLTTVANQAAAAIENARLYQQLDEKVVQLEQAQTKIAETEAALVRASIATDFVHRMNNLAGTTPVWIDLAMEQLRPSDPRDEQIKEYLYKIRQDFTGLLRAAEELDKPLYEEDVDITFLLGAMLRSVTTQYPDTIAIDTELEHDLYYVRAISTELKDAIWNVISNGLEAMPKGGKLTVRARNYADEQQKKWVKIEIKDTGSGMSSDELASVFKFFYTTKGGGRGYGLWRTKNVIEGIGGKISMESEISAGSTVIIVLPAALSTEG
jgi:GAF domain-containing protein